MLCSVKNPQICQTNISFHGTTARQQNKPHMFQ